MPLTDKYNAALIADIESERDAQCMRCCSIHKTCTCKTALVSRDDRGSSDLKKPLRARNPLSDDIAEVEELWTTECGKVQEAKRQAKRDQAVAK